MTMKHLNPDLIDPATGILLTPSYHGAECAGNGADGGEYCCEECDHFLICFPDWRELAQLPDPRVEKIVNNCVADLAFEGMECTEEDIARMRRVASGQSTADEEIELIKARYRCCYADSNER